MNGITHTRVLIYCLILGIFPLIFVSMNYFTTKSKQDRLEIAIGEAILQAKIKNNKEFLNKQVKALYRDSDHFYIDKEIETITPLKDEVETLQKILSRGFHTDEEQFRRRLQFHTSGQNSISFVEGSVKSYSDFQETQESLAHSVEADLNDVKAILSRIEGISLDGQPINTLRPHLIITDLKMEKKKGISQELFALDIKLVKREYLK